MKKTMLLSVVTALAMILSGCSSDKGGIDSAETKASDKSSIASAGIKEPENLMFGSGLAKFRDKDTDLYGYINKDGEWIIEPQFAIADPFCEGYAVAKLPDKGNFDGYCILDNTGEKIICDDYGIYSNFSSGLAVALDTETYKVGYINTDGEWVIEPQFKQAGEFVDGIAGINKNGKRGYIDVNGDWIVKPTFTYGTSFSEGLAYVEDKNGGSYYIDSKGEKAFDAPVESFAFHDGRAVVMTLKEDEKYYYGIIDKKGEWIVEPEWEYISEYSDGLCLARQDGKTGYLDINGEWAIEPEFEGAEDFSCGLASVRDNETWLYGYIDKNGDWAIEPLYSYVEPFTDDGYAYVIPDDDGEMHIIDKKGNIIK